MITTLRKSVFLGLIGLVHLPIRADQLPTWTPHEMCAEADAIVAGERVGASRVRVRKWLRGPFGTTDGGDLIEIPGLEQHRRVILQAAPQSPGLPPRRLKSQRLVCFLVKRQGQWQSMAQGETGSSGLIWVEGGRCYRYKQTENIDEPGHPAYSLVESISSRTEGELLEEIRQGLADRRKWGRVLAIENPEEQAIVLCSYLLHRTSPEGEHGTYRKRVRTLLPGLGQHAVSELTMLLRDAKAGDRLEEAVLVLKDIGPLARSAAEEIVGLLQKPGAVDAAIAIEALGRIGDSAVAPRLLPFLMGPLRVKSEVAGAMAGFAYEDSVPLIEKALPDPEDVNAEEAHHIYAILRALHELGSEATPQLARDYLGVPEMRHMHNLLEPFLEAPDRR